jgi:hypothetical protein
VDEIGLDALHHTAEIHHQTRQVAPAELALSARPKYLLDFGRHGTILHLPRSALETHVKDLMLGLRQGGEEAVVVRGIVEGKVNDFHKNL